MSSTTLQVYKTSEFQIQSCYDSHVHWLMTGEKKSFMNLEEIDSLLNPSGISIHPNQFKGDWLMGFGWHDNHFGNQKPSMRYLDLISTTYPICFIKKDAHSCLLNSKAMDLFLQRFGENSEQLTFLERDEKGMPTGVLKEATFYMLFSMLPENSDLKIKEYLLKGQQYFLENGFSHIRDMTCSQKQWCLLEELESQDLIKIHADILFNIENISDLKEKLIFLAEKRKQLFKHLHIQGIKFFLDGSLGSETAYISEPYLHTNSTGFKLWNDSDLKEALKLIWTAGLQVSIHTLGDESVKSVIEVARELQKEKVTGVLHLEHVELLSVETIQLMKGLHIRCHMQPCHWLSDQKWIDKKLSPKIKKNLFRWEALRKSKIALFFGSDSPIEEASVFLNLEALEDSAAKGIEKLEDDYLKYFSHPSKKNALSLFKNGKAVQVTIDEQIVFKT